MRLILCWFLAVSVLFGYGENIMSLKTSFIQTTFQDGQKVVYHGTLLAKRPNLAKWIYTNPLKKEIYLKQDSVLVYDLMLFQATTSKLRSKLDFFSIIKSAKPKQNSAQNSLQNSLYEATINNTRYELEVKNNLPYKISFRDDLNHLIEIIFKNPKINLEIPDSTFTFIPPEGIDIIHQ